jgi:hypothetical protein
VFQSKLVKKLQAIKLSPRICDAQNLMFVAGDMAQMQMQERSSRKYDPINPLANQILTPLSRTIVKEDCLIHLDSIYNDNGLKPNKLTFNKNVIENLAKLISNLKQADLEQLNNNK